MPDPTTTEEDTGSEEVNSEELPEETEAEGEGAKQASEGSQEELPAESDESREAPSNDEDPVKKAVNLERVRERTRGFHYQQYLKKIRNEVFENPEALIKWAEKDPKTIDEMLLDDQVINKAYESLVSKKKAPTANTGLSAAETARIVREETARQAAISREDILFNDFRSRYSLDSETEDKIRQEMNYKPGMENFEREFQKAYLYVTNKDRMNKEAKEHAVQAATMNMASGVTPTATKTEKAVKIPPEMQKVWEIAKRNDPTMTVEEFMR